MNYKQVSCELDMRNTPCPLNLVRIRLAIEDLEPESLVQVDLDKGEPEEMVISGLKQAGHNVKVLFEKESWIRLMVICSWK